MSGREVARDDRGRWLPGSPSPNPGGRASRARQALDRVAFTKLVDGTTELEDCFRALFAAARQGDVNAIREICRLYIPPLAPEKAEVSLPVVRIIDLSGQRDQQPPLGEAASCSPSSSDDLAVVERAPDDDSSHRDEPAQRFDQTPPTEPRTMISRPWEFEIQGEADL